MSGHQDRVRHEQTASRTRPSADHHSPRTIASIRIPCHGCAAQSCGKTRHSASGALDRQPCGRLSPQAGDFDGLMPDLSAHLVEHASPPSFGENPASAPIGWLGWKESRRTARLRSFVQRLLRLRDHVAEHSDRRNLWRGERLGRAIAPHCGSVERRSGRIFLVPAIHHKHVL